MVKKIFITLVVILFAAQFYMVIIAKHGESFFVKYWVECLAIISILLLVAFTKDLKNWASLSKEKRKSLFVLLIMPLIIVIAGLVDIIMILFGYSEFR
jgi:hypothetical protein